MEVNTTRFPSGIPALADWLHGKGKSPCPHQLLSWSHPGPSHPSLPCWMLHLDCVRHVAFARK